MHPRDHAVSPAPVTVPLRPLYRLTWPRSRRHSFRFSRSAFEVGSVTPGTKVRISARRFQPLRWSKHATFRAPTLLWRTPIFSGFSTSARRSSARNRSSESELVGRISRRHSQAQNSSEKCRPRSLPSQKFPPQQHGHRPVEEQSWSVHPVTVKASITLRCTTIDARAAGPPTVFALPRCMTTTRALQLWATAFHKSNGPHVRLRRPQSLIFEHGLMAAGARRRPPRRP